MEYENYKRLKVLETISGEQRSSEWEYFDEYLEETFGYLQRYKHPNMPNSIFFGIQPNYIIGDYDSVTKTFWLYNFNIKNTQRFMDKNNHLRNLGNSSILIFLRGVLCEFLNIEIDNIMIPTRSMLKGQHKELVLC